MEPEETHRRTNPIDLHEKQGTENRRIATNYCFDPLPGRNQSPPYFPGPNFGRLGGLRHRGEPSHNPMSEIKNQCSA